jgi:hypothetical protein
VNLLFLVEGDKTEPKVYRAWLKYLFPKLIFVLRPEDMTTNTCRIIGGGGYPNVFNRLETCLKDIKDFNNVDHFFICIDSEEETYSDRFDEIKAKYDTFSLSLQIDALKTKTHIIVQNCCIETWALGNAEIPANHTLVNDSTILSDFKAYYNILLDDPENMYGYPPNNPFATKARFHHRYLVEYLDAFGIRYKKKDPKVVANGAYFESLRNRCNSTNHLPSFKILLEALASLNSGQL